MTSLTPERAAAFLTAQEAVLEDVRHELAGGCKTSHWIWYIFPQLAALGRSNRARFYGIEDLQEATAYLAHPILRARLIEASQLMLGHAGKPAEDILGATDALKLRSCMTLFAAVPGAPDVFGKVLAAFFAGARCEATLALIGKG